MTAAAGEGAVAEVVTGGVAAGAVSVVVSAAAASGIAGAGTAELAARLGRAAAALAPLRALRGALRVDEVVVGELAAAPVEAVEVLPASVPASAAATAAPPTIAAPMPRVTALAPSHA